MNKICFLIRTSILILIPYLLAAQKNKSSEWQLYTEVAGIEIFYKYNECHIIEEGIHQEHVLLRFVNTGPYSMYITWHTQVFYDTFSIIDNTKENKFMLSLDGGELKEGTCDLGETKGLKIFSRFLNYDDKPTLKNFELTNIQVNPFY